MQYIGKRCANSAIAAKPVGSSAAATAVASTTPASFANKIWLSPQGEVDLHGFATNGLYYKSLLDKLKVSTHVFRVGTYKSAVEPFIRDDMSPPAKRIAAGLANCGRTTSTPLPPTARSPPSSFFPGARHIDLRKVGGDTAKYALDNKLVDELATSTEVEKALTKQFGWSSG